MGEKSVWLMGSNPSDFVILGKKQWQATSQRINFQIFDVKEVQGRPKKSQEINDQ